MNAPSSSLAPQAEGALEAALDACGSSVFNRIALEVGIPDGAVTLRKIQILYWLRARHPTTRPEMVRELVNWRGTGRNEVVASDTSTSGRGLLDQMVKDELLWEMGEPATRLLVSPKGIALLSRLHPACEDLDLAWRLVRWEAAWPSSMADVARYGSSLAVRQRAAQPRG